MDDDNGKLDENLTFFFSAREAFFVLPLPWTTTGKDTSKVKYYRHHSLQSHETGHGWVGRARLNEKKVKQRKKGNGRRKMENGKKGRFPVGALVSGEGDDEDDDNGKRSHRLS